MAAGNAKESQGKLANKHGEKAQAAAAALLLDHGFEDIGPLKHEPSRVNILEAFENRRLETLGQPALVFASAVPICHNIFGDLFTAHFLLRADTWPEAMVLMCRTQESGGTALERFEHLYANLHERLPCRALVMLSLTPSETLRPDMIRAVYRRADEWIERSHGRIARVFRGLDSFRRWLSDYAPYPSQSPSLPM